MIANRLDEMMATRDTTIAKDLKMNVKNLLTSSSLTEREGALLLLSLARWSEHSGLAELAEAKLKELGETDEVIREAAETPAIMRMLNTYYKFRKFARGLDADWEQALGPAKLRMLSLGQPKMGKEAFEILALAVSLLNSCEQCVTAHIESLRKLGVGPEKIHDVARATAAISGLAEVLKGG